MFKSNAVQASAFPNYSPSHRKITMIGLKIIIRTVVFHIMSNYSLFSSPSRRKETWGCGRPEYGFPGTRASQHQPAAAISQLLPSALLQPLAREWLHLEHNISWNSLSVSIAYCCCCLILWLASPQGLFSHYHFQFSLAHWACVLRNNFPRGDLAAFFFFSGWFSFCISSAYTFLTRHYFVLLCLYSCSVYSTCHLRTTYKFY